MATSPILLLLLLRGASPLNTTLHRPPHSLPLITPLYRLISPLSAGLHRALLGNSTKFIHTHRRATTRPPGGPRTDSVHER
ncbi:hypothetical protein E2C01_037015 [Portunus trituberculatus]|uniref:Secreted protein n=1 Tax=Portunus trituberculatus TaxID=210409 RepID=A0A5B7F712_PORTR|nr:hypothetical protein [Portunus trituberculatus]